MVTNLTRETVVLNVINQLTCGIMEFSAIIKIHEYKGLHEGHHFISMAMEVHGALGCDMDCFIKECAHFFHDKQLGGHSSLFFCIQICR